MNIEYCQSVNEEIFETLFLGIFYGQILRTPDSPRERFKIYSIMLRFAFTKSEMHQNSTEKGDNTISMMF